MIWYLAFTAAFLVYQLDVIAYSLVALLAAACEHLRPVPGHPAHERRRPSRMVCPPQRPAGALVALAAAVGGGGDDGKPAAAAGTGRMDGGGSGGAAVGLDAAGPRSAPFTGATPALALAGAAMDGRAWTISVSLMAGAFDGSAASPLAPGSPAAAAAATALGMLGEDGGVVVQDGQGPLAALTSPRLRVRPRTSSASCSSGDQGGAASPAPSGGVLSARHRHTPLAAIAAANKVFSRATRASGGSKPGHFSFDTPTLLPQSLVARYEQLPGGFPFVLVQLPMYNEEAHCEVVIERACRMEWPRDRLLIQVCDDSTRDDIRRRIDAKAASMRAGGHAVAVSRRPTNAGYKAGNLINGMATLKGVAWEYVAVFDADFEMPPDFLYQTVWHMAEDPQLAFVQARWTFTNGYDNLLCWAQRVSLNFHFSVEQRARSFLRTFFGFNGTGGVWRRAAMEGAGGWNPDSTVEDMDLSIRAYVRGWKFRYLGWVHCPNELPPTLSAYKTQQFRWNSGPMVLLKAMLRAIWTSDAVTLLDRLSCSYFFFRFVYTAFLTAVCLACPAVVIWLDPWTWEWPNYAFLAGGNASAAVFVWLAGPLFWPYFLLQTGVGYFRVFAMWNGLIGSRKSRAWKVTKKFGKGKMGGRIYHRPYLLELVLATYYLGMTFAACWWRLWLLASFTWIMAFTFAAFSFGDYLF